MMRIDTEKVESNEDLLLKAMHWRVTRAQVIAALTRANGVMNAALLVSCVLVSFF